MIGDGPVVASEFPDMSGDFFHRMMPVAPGGMVMERAAQIRPFHESGQPAMFRGLEFSLVLAQFRRDVSQPQFDKNILLRLAGETKRGIPRLLFGTEQAV